jgi:hypothetical protein
MFNKDLKFGQLYELHALKYFDYKKYKQIEGKFKDYDLLLDDNIKVEVKADRWARLTGNICIEYMCRGKPSGITTTTADYWIYFIVGTNEVFKIPTNELRDILTSNNFIKRNIGDGGLSKCFLIPKDIFKKYIQ